MPAIIYTTHAGPELGRAFAKVLSGEYSPAGRLAQTWYKSELELAPIESYDIIEDFLDYSIPKGPRQFCDFLTLRKIFLLSASI